MLTENFDEIKVVEAQKQHQLVLTFSIITGCLLNTDKDKLYILSIYSYIINDQSTFRISKTSSAFFCDTMASS